MQPRSFVRTLVLSVTYGAVLLAARPELGLDWLSNGIDGACDISSGVPTGPSEDAGSGGRGHGDVTGVAGQRGGPGACCLDDGRCHEGQVAADCAGSHCALMPTQSCSADCDCLVGGSDLGPCIPRFVGSGTTCESSNCPQPAGTPGVCCMEIFECAKTGAPCNPKDGNPCNAGDDGTCDQVCAQADLLTHTPPTACPRPPDFVPDPVLVNSAGAKANPADHCTYQTNPGWYYRFRITLPGWVQFDFCGNDRIVPVRSSVLIEDCPCDGSTDYIQPLASGFGILVGHDLCTDSSYVAHWILDAGTYTIRVHTGKFCESSEQLVWCATDVDCAPGNACLGPNPVGFDARFTFQEDCPGACCNDAYPCETADDCPPNEHAQEPPECVGGLCVDHCSEVRYVECEDAGGDWIGELTPWPRSDCKCDGDPKVCPCDLGACCLDEGGCYDWNDAGMPPEACATLGEGEHHRGVYCSHDPCPVCEFDDNLHCQLDVEGKLYLSDRYMGIRRADDFRPGGVGVDPGTEITIQRICYEFGFVPRIGPECADDPPDHDFEVRFYEDDCGFPGTDIFGGPVVVDRAERTFAVSKTWRYSGPVSPPVAVTSEDCYWIEITGMGMNDCQTHWSGSLEGNSYSMGDFDMSYGMEDVRDNDLAFCIDAGIVVPTEPGVDGGCGSVPVACCVRNATPPPHANCTQSGYRECSDLGGVAFPYAECAPDSCPAPGNDLCHIEEDPPNPGTPPTGAFTICEGDPGEPLGAWEHYSGEDLNNRLGQCDEGPGFAVFGEVCHPSAQDCSDPLDDPPGKNPCSAHNFEAYECYVETDNRLAGTDGPLDGDECTLSSSFQADVWYTVTAPCKGKAIMTMCGADSQYNSMLSVYGDHTPDVQCPVESNFDLIECNDDYCSGTGGTASGVHFDATCGAVYIIRVGGYLQDGTSGGAAQGISEIHIGFLCQAETPLVPLELPDNEEHHARKHRYISVDATTNLVNSDPCAREVAIKVEIAEMMRCQNDLRRSCIDAADCPTVCEGALDTFSCRGDSCGVDGPCIDSGPCGPHPNVGLSWFVQEPQRNEHCPEPDGPPCDDEDWYARVDSAVHTQTWGGFSTLHIGDCEIVPGVTYYVYACDPLGDPCSDPLAVGTTWKPELMPHYGDVAGSVSPQNPCCFTPPDDYTSVIDFGAYLLTNQNWGTTDFPQAHPTWIDLHGPGAGIPPQYIIMVTDLTMMLRAFVDIWPYEYTIGGKAPGDCP